MQTRKDAEMADKDTLPITAGDVTLRRLAMVDLPAFLAYRSDPDVARYQSWGETEEASARALIDDMASAIIPMRGAWRQIAVVGKDVALLGDIGLHVSEDGREAEIGRAVQR
jgi:RimJ/RimL family protein N-acetyltransferase